MDNKKKKIRITIRDLYFQILASVIVTGCVFFLLYSPIANPIISQIAGDVVDPIKKFVLSLYTGIVALYFGKKVKDNTEKKVKEKTDKNLKKFNDQIDKLNACLEKKTDKQEIILVIPGIDGLDIEVDIKDFARIYISLITVAGFFFALTINITNAMNFAPLIVTILAFFGVEKITI